MTAATPDPGNLGHWLAAAAAGLAEAGIEQARLDARLLAAEVLGWDPARVLARPERALSAAEAETLDSLLARRRRREPLAMITGRREFWGLDFRVTADTLVPRPDSETLVEAVLARLGAGGRNAPLSVLDLGTGSGCLLLALLSDLPQAAGLGVDVSAAALAVAAANARALGLSARARFRHVDWADLGGGGYDVIVANPPYVESAALARLEPEVAAFEPARALDGGADGLAHYRVLAPRIAAWLKPGGRAYVEIGATQADSAGAILRAAGLGVARVHRDLAGRPRVVETQQATAILAANLEKSVGMTSSTD